jgi:opacity protein-like surface antigen
VNAGLQLDVALNKNNIGMLIVGNGTDITNPATTYYYDYNTIQTGVTIGFGGSFKLNKSLSLISEFRYSRVYDVLPEKSGTERQAAFKVGILYPFFKKEK